MKFFFFLLIMCVKFGRFLFFQTDGANCLLVCVLINCKNQVERKKLCWIFVMYDSFAIYYDYSFVYTNHTNNHYLNYFALYAAIIISFFIGTITFFYVPRFHFWVDFSNTHAHDKMRIKKNATFFLYVSKPYFFYFLLRWMIRIFFLSFNSNDIHAHKISTWEHYLSSLLDDFFFFFFSRGFTCFFSLLFFSVLRCRKTFFSFFLLLLCIKLQIIRCFLSILTFFVVAVVKWINDLC